MHIESFEVLRTNRGIAVDLNLRRSHTHLAAIQAMELTENLDALVAAATQEGKNAIWFTLSLENTESRAWHTITLEGAQELSWRLRKSLDEWAME